MIEIFIYIGFGVVVVAVLLLALEAVQRGLDDD